MTAAALHRWHVLHLKHLAHLRYLRRERAAAGDGGNGARPPREDGASRGSRRGRNARRALAVLAGLAVVAAVVTVSATTHSAPPPGTTGAGSVFAETLTAPVTTTPVTTTPVTTIAARVATGHPPISGYPFIVYGIPSQQATVSGTIKKAAAGQVVRLYASQFPFTGASVMAGSVTLAPAGGSAGYSFTVRPILATRYQVKLFASRTARTPLGSSAPSTVYVVPWAATTGTGCDVAPTCTINLTYTFDVPPPVLAAEMAKPLYPYFAITRGPTGTSPAPPKSLTLNAGSPQVGTPHQVSASSFSVTLAVTVQFGNGASTPEVLLCQTDTEARDGLGLPGSRGCGGQTLKNYNGYVR